MTAGHKKALGHIAENKQPIAFPRPGEPGADGGAGKSVLRNLVLCGTIN